jgi:hypothetical protein
MTMHSYSDDIESIPQKHDYQAKKVFIKMFHGPVAYEYAEISMMDF